MKDEKDSKIIYKDLSYKIMEAAFEVHNELGPGFLENIYEAALQLELEEKGYEVERQKPIPVLYKQKQIGEHRLDIVVEKKIILELKAVTELNDLFHQQLLSYLKASNKKLGILINFGNKRVEHTRIVN